MFCTQLTKSYEAKTSCHQVLINSVTCICSRSVRLYIQRTLWKSLAKGLSRTNVLVANAVPSSLAKVSCKRFGYDKSLSSDRVSVYVCVRVCTCVCTCACDECVLQYVVDVCSALAAAV